MSFHFAVLITSEKCGHCRNMRGDGILFSKQKIQKEKRPANVPGGYHYDAVFMKKMITADSEIAKLRILNVNYKSFNPTEGIADISVFTLEPDSKTIRQTMLKEKVGKTVLEVYTIGEVGKKVSTQDIDTKWEDTIKTYVPSNLASYAYFYPTLSIFHFDSWMNSTRTGDPIYGYVNGLSTKEEAPYGAMPGQNPSPDMFIKFLSSFFDGTRKLLAKPEPKPVVQAPQAPQAIAAAPTHEEPEPVAKSAKGKKAEGKTCGRKVRLYVKE